MTYALGVLAVVFLILWRLAVSGRGRWMRRARGAEGELLTWMRRAEGARQLSARAGGLARKLATVRGDRNRMIDRSRRLAADLGQANERARDLQERLTAAEVRVPYPPGLSEIEATVIRADERKRCAHIADEHVRLKIGAKDGTWCAENIAARIRQMDSPAPAPAVPTDPGNPV